MASEKPVTGEMRRLQSAATEDGLLAGTRVTTLDGMIPVEFLTPGDRIVTRDGGISVLRALKVCDHAAMRAVTIRASVLGHDRPDRDLKIGPDQHILVRGWKARALYGAESALVPAARLADGEYIKQSKTPKTTRAFQLIFDAQHVIYAEGIELAMAVTIADLAV